MNRHNSLARIALPAVSAALSLLCIAIPAHGAERISLANGFDLTCNHHAVVDGRVRIYLKAAEPDYFELSPEAIRGVETVPDPPVGAKTESALSTPAIASAPIKAAEAKLTPADLHQLLLRAGSEHNVDEDLLASLVKAESDGNVRATSRAGERAG